MPIGRADSNDRLAYVERMIEHYRLEAIRRLERKALIFWRKFETRQALANFEKPLERIH